ncbi:hypothetical protein HYC85_021339 [Camellia sinensis]|uniref:AB hydrolase-1 domain-containing protein n=1 Tax=Camellia sinensis TaxID=4442 RepID=A0A7J7GHD1_CAMSI|nr:hypothetical protein HYC85_021339 [Camellia sinensis]
MSGQFTGSCWTVVEANRNQCRDSLWGHAGPFAPSKVVPNLTKGVPSKGVPNRNLRAASHQKGRQIRGDARDRQSVNNVLVFLHGFLGTGEDWIPIMKAISGSARCIAVDLPGHGLSKMQNHGMREAPQERNILQKLIQNITPGKVTLAGYSMGARIALYMALRCASKFEGAVIVSSGPGLKDVSARKIHKAKDDSRACSFINHGLELFLDTWYAGKLWNRDHPHFKQMVASRLQHDDMHTLVKVLSDSSIGRQL